MTSTIYRVTDEETGVILESYKAVIIKHESDRSKALAMFGGFIKELKIEIGGNRNPQSIFLFALN